MFYIIFKAMKTQKNLLLCINFSFIIWCFIIYPVQTFNPSSYKTYLLETVTPSYHDAYKTLNEKIVQPLLTVDINSDEITIRKLIDSLVCASRRVQNRLDKAVKASEYMSTSLEEQITTLVLSISDQEKKVKENQESVNQANNNIHHIEKQITSAEIAVQDKQHALNTAEHDMREAEKAVERARLCGRRRRKRGFGKWWRKRIEKPIVKIVRQTVVKPVCSVVNYGGINNAKDRRELAERTLNDARQRLTQHQRDLANQRALHTTAQTQLNEANSQLNSLTIQLHEQQAKQVVMTSLIKNFRGVELHLKNVLDSSVVLEDALSQLINFELVVAPLNRIYHEMLTNNVMQSINYEISVEMTSKIQTNLKILSDKMPKMPVNEIIVEDNSITCV